MTYEFRPAMGVQSNPVIAISGRPGSGKTMGSLLIARGWVGPTGRIAQIDTEERRGSVFKNTIPGGYDTLSLTPPFTPESFIEAIEAAEQAEYDIIILDSVSHEWSGVGGVLDTVEGKGLGAWKEPKARHQKFVRKLLTCKVPIIPCLRAAYKNKQGKDANGKTVIVKDDLPSSIQEDTFTFEMTAHILTMHNIQGLEHPPVTKLKKFSPPELRDCFPADFTDPLSIETGQKIAAWTRGEIDKNTQSLQDEARSHAKRGRESLQAWWEGQPQSSRKTVNPIMDELKKLAASPSEARQDTAPDPRPETPDESNTATDAPSAATDDTFPGDRSSAQPTIDADEIIATLQGSPNVAGLDNFMNGQAQNIGDLSKTDRDRVNAAAAKVRKALEAG